MNFGLFAFLSVYNCKCLKLTRLMMIAHVYDVYGLLGFVRAVSNVNTPNDSALIFCQRCGNKRGLRTPGVSSLKATINWKDILEREDILDLRLRSSPYSKQKSALEKEFCAFILAKSSPSKDIVMSTPDPVFEMEGFLQQDCGS